jgi:hypothetical protein
MKASILLLLSSVLLCSCVSKNHENSLSDKNLNGKVKAITIHHYRGEIVSGKIVAKDYMSSPIIFGMELGKEYNSEIEEYNKYGSVAKLYFGKDGLFDSINIYDKKLNLIHKSIYNKNGKLSTKMRYQEDGSVNTIDEYKYQGNCLIECIHKDKWGESSTKYKSNSEGIAEEIIDYNDESIVKWKQTNTIENHKIVKSILYSSMYLHPEYYEDAEDSEDALPIVTTYTYHGDNLSVVERTKGTDKSVYFINEYGNIDKCYINNTIFQYNYNSNNDLEMRDDLYHFEYEYDEMNNWIKRISYQKSKPLQIDQREIEYY